MPVQVRDVLSRAQKLIQDETGIRWPLPELACWFNDGTREVAIHKPSASAKSVVLPLVRGTRQTIPAGALMLLRVIRNLKSGSTESNRLGGRAVRIVNRDVLDTQHPDWHDEGSTVFGPQVKHFVFDESDPTAFYVYPGNDGQGHVEALVSHSPEPVETTGVDLADYAVDMPLPDVYANAVLDYVLYRAYSKDASFAENFERANAHYNAFAMSLGLKISGEYTASASNAGHHVTRDRVGSAPVGGGS
ncbi:DUF6682 family protein [Vreelandella massiliensis]|uniref:phage adaptor protein n=1 Tax=Vreelandella massiliensis TaxID=1816686 RepID=UPI00096AC1A9|nr:DUF6682 family protein [Halomonas massiliensis]